MHEWQNYSKLKHLLIKSLPNLQNVQTTHLEISVLWIPVDQFFPGKKQNGH